MLMGKRLVLTHEVILGIIVLVVVAAFSVMAPGFTDPSNLADVLVAASFTGILAAGLLVVLVAGGIDISFTATATITQYLAALAILHAGADWTTAFAISVIVGFALGACNAVIIYVLGVSPIIVTIATLNLFFGALMAVSRGNWLYGFPTWFAEGISAGTLTLGDERIVIGLPLLALFATWGCTWFLLEKSPWGRALYAMGSNQDAARRIGLRLFRLHLLAYGYMGITAGIAGLTQAQLTQNVAPNAFVGRELAVLAAVVLGGASLTGGAGTILGTILGVLLIAFLQNGLTLMAVSSYSHPVLLGLIVLASVSFNAYRQKSRSA
jgi:simple sugar transport system permease protein